MRVSWAVSALQSARKAAEPVNPMVLGMGGRGVVGGGGGGARRFLPGVLGVTRGPGEGEGVGLQGVGGEVGARGGAGRDGAW